MSKFDFILFSDFHAHNFPYASTRVTIPDFSGLYNSRLRDSWGVLDDIQKYAKEHNIHHACFGGDMFHSRLSVSTDVRCVISRKLFSIAQDDEHPIYLDLLIGNHDMGDKFGLVHSMVGLDQAPNISVYDNFVNYSHLHTDVDDLQQVGVLFVPYTPDLEMAKRALKEAERLADGLSEKPILIAHLGMQGARVGSDYVLISDSDIKVADIHHDKFAACFFGHFHEHQKLFPNGWFIGATHEHNWGDSGGSRGFLHVTVEDGKVSFKQIQTNAPKFLTIMEGECTASVRPVDFVKFVGSNEWLETMKQVDVAHGEYMPPTLDSSMDFSLDTTNLDPSTLLKQWTEAKAADSGLDPSEALELGQRLLAKVNY